MRTCTALRISLVFPSNIPLLSKHFACSSKVRSSRLEGESRRRTPVITLFAKTIADATTKQLISSQLSLFSQCIFPSPSRADAKTPALTLALPRQGPLVCCSGLSSGPVCDSLAAWEVGHRQAELSAEAEILQMQPNHHPVIHFYAVPLPAGPARGCI